jgi:predicted DNA-binding protein (MmcQ/YjbR family)
MTHAGFEAAAQKLRRIALTYPGTYEECPWGDRVVKVKGKIFLFCNANAARLSIAVKLPRSGALALALPFAKPSNYGLGKAGWVTAILRDDEPVPFPVFESWIEESYQAVAPKRILAELPVGISKPATRARSGTVLVSSLDPFRLERSRKALHSRGVHTVTGKRELAAIVASIQRHAVSGVLIDVGRSPTSGLQLVRELLDIAKIPPVIIAGLRDTGADKRCVAAFAEAPGDDDVVAAVVDMLGSHSWGRKKRKTSTRSGKRSGVNASRVPTRSR